MSSASSKEALRQLDQFWSMLDDLCENDPAAYRRFIEKQMKEGAEYSSPPEIHTCLRTEILVSLCDSSGSSMCLKLGKLGKLASSASLFSARHTGVLN